jgi:hypothetical protein
MFNGISLGFKVLSIKNILLIDDCPFKCMGNAPYSYNLPPPFNSEKND